MPIRHFEMINICFSIERSLYLSDVGISNQNEIQPCHDFIDEGFHSSFNQPPTGSHQSITHTMLERLRMLMYRSTILTTRYSAEVPRRAERLRALRNFFLCFWSLSSIWYRDTPRHNRFWPRDFLHGTNEVYNHRPASRRKKSLSPLRFVLFL